MFDFPSPSPGLIITGPEFIRYQWSQNPDRWVAIAGERPPVPISFAWAGKPPAGSQINVPIIATLRIPIMFEGTRYFAATPATSLSERFRFYRVVAGGATEIGALFFLPGGGHNIIGSGDNITSGTTLVPGDVLRVLAPVNQDTTLADVGITVLAERV